MWVLETGPSPLEEQPVLLTDPSLSPNSVKFNCSFGYSISKTFSSLQIESCNICLIYTFYLLRTPLDFAILAGSIGREFLKCEKWLLRGKLVLVVTNSQLYFQRKVYLFVYSLQGRCLRISEFFCANSILLLFAKGTPDTKALQGGMRMHVSSAKNTTKRVFFSVV